jgi:hypothetical protein
MGSIKGNQTSEPPLGAIPNSDMGPEVSIPFEDVCAHVITGYFLCSGYRIQPGTHSNSKLPGREGTGERTHVSSCGEP